ncbi:MAG: tetratricopeptide repeat protein [Planctomycetes bacterium]|nr:tetratricopeptide repeat protein [Planctomycetota bacterium]
MQPLPQSRLSAISLFVFGWPLCLAYFSANSTGIAYANQSDSTPQAASTVEDVRALMQAGEYEQAIAAAKKQVDKRVWNESWPRLLIEGYLTVGDYDRARSEYELAIERFSDSIPLRLLGVQVYRMTNNAPQAEKQLDEIETLLRQSPWRYSNRSNLVPVGEFYLMRGEDPKQVLKICFDQAVKLDPKNVDAHVATARMALSKNDAQVAAQSLDKALALAPKDPEVLYLAAKAWNETERGRKEGFLQRSLESNPRFVPSLLYAAEKQMDSERYEAAREILNRVEAIQSRNPILWSLRAAIAHLTGDYELEGNARRTALERWNLNPEVDHTIGRHLSLHYRFEEGAEYQRRSLAMAPNYAPARTQLAQDLLRLGRTEEGWSLVDGIRQSDPYDVSIYNLKQLQAKLAKFTTLEAPGFVVRMDTKEAEIYGDDVMLLLRQARETLVPKYRAELQEPIFVEIFPRQQEFAIRTFGMPGGEGFLGVCFGRLITANSPAALQVDSNWRSVLWHEYCHVVTLQKTKNKMPRWLSEGISVYEERQRDPAWGEQINPTYREMLLADDMVPISRLSGAFLNPKSPLHLQFAYFASSLAVEFWIERFEMKGLQKLLEDLSIGMRQEEALARLPGSLEILDQEFLEFVRDKARQMAPSADFAPLPKDPSLDLQSWLAEHPNSYFGNRQALEMSMKSKDWGSARKIADHLIALWPDDSSNEGIYWKLAVICRELGDHDAEYNALIELSRRASSPREGLLRVTELAKDRQSKTMLRTSDILQGVDPMSDAVQELRSFAAEQTEDPYTARNALRALLALDPIDPASVLYRLARSSLKLNDKKQAKRYCLQSLEESPRFIDALDLLLELRDSANDKPLPDNR